MKWSRVFARALMLGAVFASPAALAQDNKPVNLALGSVAATSGVYAFSVALANVVSKNDSGLNVTAVEGGGGFDHAKLMKQGVLDLSVSGSPAVVSAVRAGTGGFQKEGAWEPARLMFMRNVNVARVYVRADLAAILNIPYLQVIGYAAIPCLLFYTGILAGVHFKARRSGLAPAPASELPRAREVLTWSRLTPLFLPVGILLFLLFRGANLTATGFWACIAVVVLFLFADLRPSGIAERARRLVAAFGDGGEAIARIAPVLIAVSLFTSLLGLTGVAPKVSGLILDMGGETLIASLAVAAIIPLVLGAPLPVTATYILSAALIAPALIRLQLDQVSVHMFLLYWATLASVTPPTCTACVIGASIAGGNWFRTSLVAMRLGIVAFLMPFFFVLNPALIARGPLFDVVTATASGLAGAILLAAGFFGYLTSPLNLAVRGIYLVAGCLLLAPDNRLFLAGIAIALAGYGLEFFSARRRAGRPLP